MTKQDLLGRWWYRLLQVLFVIALLVAEARIFFEVPWFTINGTLTDNQKQSIAYLASARNEGKPEAEVRRAIEEQTRAYQHTNVIVLGFAVAFMVFVFFAFILLKRIFLYVVIAQPIFRWPRHS